MIDLSSRNESKTHQVPEWEGQTAASKKGIFSTIFATKATAEGGKDPVVETGTDMDTPAKATLSERFNRALPPNRRYFGMTRKVFLLALAGLLALLVLVLGLGLGLGLKKHSSGKNLPLPSNTATFTGDLTYYAPGLGACGITSSSTDAICAVSHIIFDAAQGSSSNPNANPLCGKKIRITRYNEAVNAERSVDVTVVDRCVGCVADDLDLSLSMFTQLADEGLGRVTGTWAWLA
ncbi:hypothetical protein BP5796_08906 [Coleophoma crateriformis]|uniref:RlpA-like protein double-psi beta-barrel domain-containing protein n=1 Tax=Coleophoma crateriformis TaxID=565419 RepID=A0A3D8R2I6_9HELO|nr:hypothetical protein BP5796_08906 [Coleophoma crateriformis]